MTIDTRDVDEALLAETEASGSETEARRSRVRGETEAYVSEMIYQSFKSKVKNKHRNEIILFYGT